MINRVITVWIQSDYNSKRQTILTNQAINIHGVLSISLKNETDNSC